MKLKICNERYWVVQILELIKLLDTYLSCSEIKKLYLVNIFISDISQIVQLLIGFK